MTSLTGRVALVTGASSGIGRAVAQAFLRADATVVLAARRRDALEETVAQCSATNPSVVERAHVHVADMTDAASCAALAGTVEAEHGVLDILVHAAADYRRGAMAAAPLEDMDSQWAANVRGPFALTQAVLPLLVRRKSSVVFMNSRSGVVATPNAGQYSVTKYALKGLADALRDELNDKGVRVTSIYLGRVATPMQERAARHEGAAYRPERLLQPADVAEVVLCAVSLPWTAEITDIHLRHMMKP
jgi:NADP-dependent 3-hydroxy acid dehydrogenase YdfG